MNMVMCLRRAKTMKGYPNAVAILAMVAVLALLAGCKSDAENQDAQAVPPATVEAITVQAQPFVLSSELPGRIEPVRVAEVRARVVGIILSRNFTEGADVKAGQVLFQIDPAPYKAALSRAQGDLARADALLSDAQSIVGRYAPLVEVEAVSNQEFDTMQATLKGAQAARQSAKAEVEAAQLNLEYTTVRSPISGRIGRALVTEGALVGQNEATPLATIQQLDPIYVDFRQSVADVLRLRDALAAGRLTQKPNKGVPISVSVEGANRRREGRLLFSDITVDRGTGQISLRGQLANADGLLLPGMYVRAHIDQGTDPNAILVPQRAVQHTSDGSAQVLLIGQDDVVQARSVITGAMQGSQWLITEGLQPGDRVIVGGSAAPGTKVAVADTRGDKL